MRRAHVLADKGELLAPARQRRQVGARDVHRSQPLPRNDAAGSSARRAKRQSNGLRNRRPEALVRQRQAARADAPARAPTRRSRGTAPTPPPTAPTRRGGCPTATAGSRDPGDGPRGERRPAAACPAATACARNGPSAGTLDRPRPDIVEGQDVRKRQRVDDSPVQIDVARAGRRCLRVVPLPGPQLGVGFRGRSNPRDASTASARSRSACRTYRSISFRGRRCGCGSACRRAPHPSAAGDRGRCAGRFEKKGDIAKAGHFACRGQTDDAFQ